MTLDEARDAFRDEVTPDTIGNYLAVALDYWSDDMIHDDTFSKIVQACISALKHGETD